MTPKRCVTDPKLVIEVLSPSTRGNDKRDKFILYRSLPLLREYLLIDSARRQVEAFPLADAGAWLMTDQTGFETLRLASIGCTVAMEQVFKGV